MTVCQLSANFDYVKREVPLLGNLYLLQQLICKMMCRRVGGPSFDGTEYYRVPACLCDVIRQQRGEMVVFEAGAWWFGE